MVRSRYDTRYVVGCFPPAPTDRAEVSGWIRPIDGSSIDLAALVALCDAWPPPIMMLTGPTMVARTIDYTVHLFETLVEPIADWVAMTNRSTVSTDGYVDTETEAWTADGRLLAQARQLSVSVPWSPQP
jgi:acyl-CoA thioesterase